MRNLLHFTIQFGLTPHDDECGLASQHSSRKDLLTCLPQIFYWSLPPDTPSTSRGSTSSSTTSIPQGFSIKIASGPPLITEDHFSSRGCRHPSSPPLGGLCERFTLRGVHARTSACARPLTRSLIRQGSVSSVCAFQCRILHVGLQAPVFQPFISSCGCFIELRTPFA